MSDLLTTGTLAPPAKVSASMISAHLAEVYSEAEGYACLFEVSNGTGSNARTRADAVVMSLWPSRGYEIAGYEIKVSRSDWQSELKQPDKAWPVMQFCDRWILLSAPGVAKLDEIPLTWGWQEFDGKKLRVKKAAPALDAKPITRSFIASMVRRPVRDVEEMARRAAEKRKKELDDDFDRRVKKGIAFESERVAQAEAKIAAIKEATGIDLHSWRVDGEAVAAALKFAMTAEPFKRYGGLATAVSNVQIALNHLQALEKHVAEFTLPEGP